MPNGSPLLRSVLLTIAAHIVFLIPQPFLTPDQQTELWSGILTAACLWGIWRWGKTGWRAYTEGSEEPWHYGILAIVLLLSFFIIWRLYGVLYVRNDRPVEWLQYPTTAYIVFGFTVAVVLFSAATKLDGEKPSRLMGVITAIGAALAIFLSSVWPLLVSKGGAIARFFNSIF